MQKVTFANSKSPFYSALKKEVNQYFKDKNLSPWGNWKLYIKAIVFLTLTLAFYTWLVFFTPVWYVALPLCALLGLNLAFIGFNVMHDACHGSYSSKKWVNDLMGYSMNFLGSNAHMWKTKHNVVHHTFTNIDGIDDDIMKIPVLRHTETQKKLKMHRYQHIYSSLIYALTIHFWVWLMDFIKYFSGKVVVTPIKDFTVKEHIIFWVSKLWYVGFYIALPLYMVGFTKFIIGFMVMNAFFGLVLSLVFQLAHVVEKAHFEEAIGRDKQIDKEWAVHQVITTCNFATHNKVISWFLGGLNFQIEHHLFPKVSHVHYPEISRIVERICQEHNVTYNNYSTVTSAVASHYKVMRDLGR
jgi:linoleoyl-CoA desaturase